MKKICLLTLVFLLMACQQEGILTGDKADGVIAPTATLKYYGVFEPTGGISVTGEARIYLENNVYQVQLANFSISEGPDLKVYLSKSNTPSDFVNLGNLSSQTIYPVPNGVEVSEYAHVLIHCQQYNHLYAIAPLLQN